MEKVIVIMFAWCFIFHVLKKKKNFQTFSLVPTCVNQKELL